MVDTATKDVRYNYVVIGSMSTMVLLSEYMLCVWYCCLSISPILHLFDGCVQHTQNNWSKGIDGMIITGAIAPVKIVSTSLDKTYLVGCTWNTVIRS